MTNWRVRAACRDTDPELFFPYGTAGPALLQQAEAKRVCHQCPVRGECLTDALNQGEEFGVRGGASELQRRDMLRTPEAARRSNKTNELEPDEVDDVLHQLDNRRPVADVAAEVGISQQLCHGIWRQYRPGSKAPRSGKTSSTAA